MINFKCKKCGHSHRVGEKYTGLEARCGHCGYINIVPRVYMISMDSAGSIPRTNNGVTPDFNALFIALMKQQQAPVLELAYQRAFPKSA